MESKPNLITMEAIDAAENDKDMHGPFNTVSDLFESLDKSETRSANE